MLDTSNRTADPPVIAALAVHSHEGKEKVLVDLTEPFELSTLESEQTVKPFNALEPKKTGKKSQQRISPTHINQVNQDERSEEKHTVISQRSGMGTTSSNSKGKKTARANERKAEDSNELEPVAMQPSELVSQISEQNVEEPIADVQPLSKQDLRTSEDSNITPITLPSEEYANHIEDDPPSALRMVPNQCSDNGHSEEDSTRQLQQSNHMSTSRRSSSSVGFAPQLVNQGTSDLFHGSREFIVNGGEFHSVAGNMIQRTGLLFSIPCESFHGSSSRNDRRKG
ncbi:hypothetical protein BDQ17DRAFT_646689 [Cyathus striatus]|nr:hypothetical protein BDQ17DRAFT_646689 [Cyathus striatus]